MGSAIQGFARGCEAESCDFKTCCGYTHNVWRSDGVHESAGLFVRVVPFLRHVTPSNYLLPQARLNLHYLRP